MRVVLTGCSVREPDRSGRRRYPASTCSCGRTRSPSSWTGWVCSAQAASGRSAPAGGRCDRPSVGPSSASRTACPRPGHARSGRGPWPRFGDQRLAPDHLRLRQDLHLLHRAVQPRAGASRPFDEILDEARGLVAAGSRGDAARPDVDCYGHDLAPEARFGHIDAAPLGGPAARPARPSRPGRAHPGHRWAAHGRRPSGDRRASGS